MPIYTAGNDGSHRLGRVGSGQFPAMVPVDTKNLLCLAVGWRHSIVIFQDGSALCWGDNTEFQLGMTNVTEIPRPIPLECLPEEQLTWAHCGDKCTAFLTASGKVFTCGISTSKRILELQIPKPAIFVSSGCAMTVAIDDEGSVYKANSGTTSVQMWTLPDPVCDVACGSDLILALTTQGQVFSLGTFAMEGRGRIGEFNPVPSLANIQVSRVFAYNTHAAVITRDGRVMMCGSGPNEILGFDDNEPHTRFEFLTDLDGANIIEIDMGDAFTVFIGHDGSIYSCGSSDDGRLMCAENSDLVVPTRSMHVPGKAVFVRCGCFHTAVVTDAPRPVHPGLKFFNLTGNLVSIARSILIDSEIINTAASSLTMYNLMPGDIIKTDDFGEGFAVGVSNSNILCCFNGVLREVAFDKVQFVGRRGFEGTVAVTGNGETVTFDGGIICNLFGFRGGSTVIGPDEKPYKVMGYAHGTVWFADESGRVLCLKDDDLPNLHATFKYPPESGIKYVDTNDGRIPIEPLEPFYAKSKNNVMKVLGSFGNSFYGTGTLGEILLIPKPRVFKLHSNSSFIELDRVIVRGQIGTVVACLKDSVAVFTDEDLMSGHQPSVYRNSEAELVARIAGKGFRNYRNVEYDVSLEGASFASPLPSDLYYGPKGYVTVIGRRNGLMYAADEDGEPFEFDVCGYILMRRRFKLGRHIRTIKTSVDFLVNVSTCTTSMASVGALQGDEVVIQGRHYIVCGIRDHYVWLVDCETQMFCGVAVHTTSLKSLLTVYRRPSDRKDIFIVDE